MTFMKFIPQNEGKILTFITLNISSFLTYKVGFLIRKILAFALIDRVALYITLHAKAVACN